MRRRLGLRPEVSKPKVDEWDKSVDQSEHEREHDEEHHDAPDPQPQCGYGYTVALGQHAGTKRPLMASALTARARTSRVAARSQSPLAAVITT